MTERVRCASCGRFAAKRVEHQADGSWARTVWTFTCKCDDPLDDY